MRWALLVLVALGLEAQTGAGWKEAIAWLPPETETLIVNAKPYRLPEASAPAVLASPFLNRFLSFSVFQELKSLVPELASQEVAYSVFGLVGMSQQPRQQVLGIMPFVSLSVLRLRQPRVLVSEGVHRFENRISTWFVTQPEPDLLLVSSEENLLPDALARKGGKGPGLQLPAATPVWADVDPRAETFALRRYLAGAGLMPGQVIDTKAVHLVWNSFAGGEKPTLVYRTESEDAKAKIEEIWPSVNGQKIEWTLVRPKVWRTTSSIEELSLMFSFGFVMAF